MENYWITLCVQAADKAQAEKIAARMATSRHTRVVQVDHEPPQGALIVGDHHEDDL